MLQAPTITTGWLILRQHKMADFDLRYALLADDQAPHCTIVYRRSAGGMLCL